MPNVFTLKPLISDVLKWECDYKFCRDSFTVALDDDDTAVEVVCGETYVKATGAKVTDDTFDCIALENATISPGETRKILCLVRGPAIVNPTNIATELEEAALTTALAGMNVIEIREPAIIGVQNT